MKFAAVFLVSLVAFCSATLPYGIVATGSTAKLPYTNPFFEKYISKFQPTDKYLFKDVVSDEYYKPQLSNYWSVLAQKQQDPNQFYASTFGYPKEDSYKPFFYGGYDNSKLASQVTPYSYPYGLKYQNFVPKTKSYYTVPEVPEVPVFPVTQGKFQVVPVPQGQYPTVPVTQCKYPCVTVPEGQYPTIPGTPCKYPCVTVPEGQYPTDSVTQCKYPCVTVPEGQYPAFPGTPCKYPCLTVPEGQYPTVPVTQCKYPCVTVPQSQYPFVTVPQCQCPTFPVTQGKYPFDTVPQGKYPFDTVPQGKYPAPWNQYPTVTVPEVPSFWNKFVNPTSFGYKGTFPTFNKFTKTWNPVTYAQTPYVY